MTRHFKAIALFIVISIGNWLLRLVRSLYFYCLRSFSRRVFLSLSPSFPLTFDWFLYSCRFFSLWTTLFFSLVLAHRWKLAILALHHNIDTLWWTKRKFYADSIHVLPIFDAKLEGKAKMPQHKPQAPKGRTEKNRKKYSAMGIKRLRAYGRRANQTELYTCV